MGFKLSKIAASYNRLYRYLSNLMTKRLWILLIVFLAFHFSCDNKGAKSSEQKAAGAVIALSKTFSFDSKAITQSFLTWYKYTYRNIRLSQPFIGLDVNAKNIDKTAFLNKMITENVVAFKIGISNNVPVYQLFKLTTNDESIGTTIKQMATTEMKFHKMEGTELPAFHFTDMAGKVYNKSTTKGKILVLKCWFIHCVACVQEFPELNLLVDEMQQNNEVLFISLAMDNKTELKKFLQKKEFKYAVIPDMEPYMVSQLQVTEYPTHFLINSNGTIIKATNRIDDLIPFLKKEVNKRKK